MPPPVDFDSQQRASERWAYVLAFLFYASAFALCRYSYGTVIGFLVSSPVLGVYASWWLLNRGGGSLRWLKWWTLREVDGRHYAFQDHPVRVRWHEGQCVVRARDAFAVMAEEAQEQDWRRLATRFGEAQFFMDADGDWWFGESAVLQWLESRAERFDARAQKFRLWLMREVFPPLHRWAETS